MFYYEVEILLGLMLCSDEDFVRWVRCSGELVYYFVGICKMGLDLMVVVDF